MEVEPEQRGSDSWILSNGIFQHWHYDFICLWAWEAVEPGVKAGEASSKARTRESLRVRAREECHYKDGENQPAAGRSHEWVLNQICVCLGWMKCACSFIAFIESLIGSRTNCSVCVCTKSLWWPCQICCVMSRLNLGVVFLVLVSPARTASNNMSPTFHNIIYSLNFAFCLRRQGWGKSNPNFLVW